MTIKRLFSALLLLVGLSAGAQTIRNDQYIIGTVDTVRSQILNETRNIGIYVPKGANDSSFARKRYPVVYLLDGDSHFMSVAGMIQQLSQVNGNTILPEMIIVAIPNTDRVRDLTPTNSLSYMGKNEPGFKTSGGGENFLQFMQKELMPYIDAKYPTAPYKMLIGHSFGGLTVMNALINHTEMFNSYVAIDPSMWWHDQKLLNESVAAFKEKRFSGRSLFIGIANTARMDTSRVRRDTSVKTLHERSILRLKEVLQSNAGNQLQFASKYYPNDDHGSVPFIAEYDAFRFIFKNYPVPTALQAQLTDPSTGTLPVKALAEHYRDLSRRMGYTINPPGDKINEIGHYLLKNETADKAFSLFMLNINNYPNSARVYAAMGDYYAFKKNNANAILYYRKALTLKKDKEIEDKLEALMPKK